MKTDTLSGKSTIIPNPKGYVLLKEIGRGGFGTVYKAVQTSSGIIVAIKTLKFTPNVNSQKRKQHLARFERETQICSDIDHPHIVKLLDKGFLDKDEPFAVFEFVPGVTLKDLIIQNLGLSAGEAGIIMGQVLAALAYAHHQGVIHRDLKPQNIMVNYTNAEPQIKVLDFGISTFTRGAQNISGKDLTLTPGLLGTPTYCAPEQLRGETPDVKSDLYAWGLILLECLTGQPAIRGRSIAEVLQQQLNPSKVTIPHALSGHPLGDLLQRVLDKNHFSRMRNANMVADEYSKINFGSLSDKLHTSDVEANFAAEETTTINYPGLNQNYKKKKQITVLSIKLNLSLTDEYLLDYDILSDIQNDQIKLCKATVSKFGGHVTEQFAGKIVVEFGYLQKNEHNVLQAAKAALALIKQVQKNSDLSNIQNGIRFHICMSINSGTVFCHPKQTLQRLVPGSAFSLLNYTQPSDILVTIATKKILDPFMKFELADAYQLNISSQTTLSYRLTGES